MTCAMRLCMRWRPPAGTLIDETWAERRDSGRYRSDPPCAPRSRARPRTGSAPPATTRDLARSHKGDLGQAVAVIAAGSVGEPGTPSQHARSPHVSRRRRWAASRPIPRVRCPESHRRAPRPRIVLPLVSEPRAERTRGVDRPRGLGRSRCGRCRSSLPPGRGKDRMGVESLRAMRCPTPTLALPARGRE
jgi:hypothetical protein